MKKYLIVLVSIIILNQLSSQEWIDSLKIVDYHVHVFSEELTENLKGQGYPIKESNFKIESVEKQIESDEKIKLVLISGGYSYKELYETEGNKEIEVLQRENELLSELVSKYPKKVLGFYGINPLKDYSIEEIRRCDEKLGLHGIKLHLQGNHVELKDTNHLKKLREVLKLASQKNIPLLIHNNAWDLDSGKEFGELFVEKILRETESLTIIFAHTGGGGGYTNFTKDFLKVMREYIENDESSKRHKIYFELSATILKNPYPQKRLTSELEKIIFQIGIGKFLFGSDYPVMESKEYVRELMSQLNMNRELLKQIIERDIFEEIREK